MADAVVLTIEAAGNCRLVGATIVDTRVVLAVVVDPVDMMTVVSVDTGTTAVKSPVETEDSVAMGID